MEIGNIILGVVLTSVCIMPFVLLKQSRKRKEKKLLKILHDMAAEQQCHIDQHEVLGEMALGMDSVRRFVFFFKANNSTMQTNFINLAEIRTCRTGNASKAVSSKDNHFSVIDKVQLIFTPVVKSKPEIAWTLYDAEESTQLFGELEMTEKWETLINKALKIK